MYRNQVPGTAAAAVLLIASGVAVGRPAVQAQSATTPQDVLPALLVEVKGLRAAMEQMAGAGPRVQLVVSRLQLQEGRIAGMIRRLDTVRDSLATGRRELEKFRGAVKMMEGSGEPEEPGAPKEDFGPILNGMKQQFAAAQADIDRLAAEEIQLTQELAVEQARWVDFNQRLDELEKALAKR